MKNKMLLVSGILVLLLVATGFVLYKALIASPAPVANTQPVIPKPESMPAVSSSVSVDLTQSAKPYTLMLDVKGLNGTYTTIGYEFSYVSNGLIKGVNSGSSPIDVTGKNEFTRDVYLGTCSGKDCTPDKGVNKVSVVLEFTDTSGAKSQFSKDFNL